MRHYVIIGAGVAALSAAQAIRQQDNLAEILMVSDDPFGYYSRPGLAYYLNGEVTEEYLFPFSEKEIQQLNFFRIQDRVTQILPDKRRVLLSSGGGLGYDALLLATGAAAAIPPVQGIELQGVVKLDNLYDARQILSLSRKARRAVVVGGGITALELVEGLCAQGVETHFFLRGDHYWSSVLDEIESRLVETRLIEEGVQIHTHTELSEALGKHGSLEAVRTTRGELIQADILAVAIGIQPRKELADGCGLKTDRGILVNERMQTSCEEIFAAGDVAQVYDPASGKWILDSLWGPAREQGRHAGMNMAGLPALYTKPPAFNVTRLSGLAATIIGAVGRGRSEDEVDIAHGESQAWRDNPDAIVARAEYHVNHLRVIIGKDTLLGAVVMGDQTLSHPLQYLILNHVDITPIRDELIAPGDRLGAILQNFWLNLATTHAA
ncbi:MAG: FAD-dependent oxidoreductase [Chloroflexi bacterium]|nr:FAD-dependent oxidoreductase [Chloroflexota bacterium]